jgi:hypothetical protein
MVTVDDSTETNDDSMKTYVPAMDTVNTLNESSNFGDNPFSSYLNKEYNETKDVHDEIIKN